MFIKNLVINRNLNIRIRSYIRILIIVKILSRKIKRSLQVFGLVDETWVSQKRKSVHNAEYGVFFYPFFSLIFKDK
jgi:hypothetical protein